MKKLLALGAEPREPAALAGGLLLGLLVHAGECRVEPLAHELRLLRPEPDLGIGALLRALH